MKIEFEKAANETPEFQALSPEKQTEQGQLLFTALSGLSASAKLGVSQREIAIRTGELLERALTGMFDGIQQPIEPPQKPKKRQSRRKG